MSEEHDVWRTYGSVVNSRRSCDRVESESIMTAERTLTEDENNEPLVVKDQAEFLVWSDGDLEIELTGARFADNGWTGTYLTREEAIRLRDYLVRKYP